MKVAVIGSGSFIGRSIYSNLKDKYSFRLIDRKEYEFPNKSFRSGFALQELLEQDAIIHCVASGVQSNHQVDDAEMIEVNLFEPIRLCDFLQKNAYKGRIVTFGSYFSIGQMKAETPQNEEMFVENKEDFISTYAMTKGMFSNYSYRANRNFNHTHMVLTNVYGPNENERRLFPYIFDSVKNNELMSFSSGQQVRQFTHAVDVVSAIDKVLDDQINGVFHFTNPSTISVKNAIMCTIDLAESFFGKKAKFEFGELSKKDAEMPFLALSNRKFEKAYGEMSYTTLEDGLKTYLK